MTLNEWRKEKGWTLQQLADELEVDISFVMRLSNGRRKPGPELYEKIFFVTEGKVEPNDFFALPEWRVRLAAVLEAARALLRGQAA